MSAAEVTVPVAAKGVPSDGGVTSRGGKATRTLVNLAAAGALLYLFVPMFLIVAFSFNKPKSKFNFVWQGFTFENWLHPGKYPELVDAIALSLKVALFATVIATIFGALIAIALVRYRFRGGKALDLLLVVPLTTPEIVMGASLYTLFLDGKLVPFLPVHTSFGFTTILVAHVMFCVSFVALTVKARIRGFDWTLEDAASDLGARPARTFFRITLPLITPGILAAALLSFALSIDDFLITLFVTGDAKTFPIQVFQASRSEVRPQVQVISTAIMLVSVLILAGPPIVSLLRRPKQSPA